MSTHRSAYGFDGLPLSPIGEGTNVLVTGPALGGIRRLVLKMLCRQEPREGALLIAADVGGIDALTDYESIGGDLDAARVGVVDCTENSVDDERHNIHAVGSPSDLTGVGIEFSSLYEQLVANGATSVRTGIYTLSPFVMYADTRAVYRFLHTLTGRIRTAEGFGVCALDPGTLDDRMFASLAQAFDGQIRLRQSGGETEIAVDGLTDQPDGWQTVDLS